MRYYSCQCLYQYNEDDVPIQAFFVSFLEIKNKNRLHCINIYDDDCGKS